MTPAEHYATAERMLSEITDHEFGMLGKPADAVALGALDRGLAKALVHATLATVPESMVVRATAGATRRV